MIKRATGIVITLIAIFTMCLAFSISVSAEGTLEFKVTTSEFISNKVTATVSIEDNPGLASYVVALKYDKSKFRPIYNESSYSAVVDKKLYDSYMDDIVSNSDGLGSQDISNLDYITAVGVTNMYNMNLAATGDIFSIDFEVLDADARFFACEFEVIELFTYDPSDLDANEDGYAPLDFNIINADGIYTVEHYKELLNGEYEIVSETYFAPVGSSVSATRKNFDSHLYDSSAGNIRTGIVEMDGSLVLKCYYKLRTYNVIYNYGEATQFGISSNTAKYGSVVPVPDETTFSKTNYTFKGWYTQPNGQGEKITSDTVVDNNLEIYAYWVEKPTYSVKHYLENLDGTYSEQILDKKIEYSDENKYVTAIPNTYEGFTFNQAESITSGNVLADNSTVLELRYDRNIYTVKFYNATGEVLDTQSVKYQGSAIQPQAPSKASTEQYDYTFTGWDKEFANVVQNLDIYPQYSQTLRSYTVTYDYQGATTVGIASNVVEYGEKIVLPDENTFEKTNFEFAGWYYSDVFDESDKVKTNDTVQGTVTIYAKWVSQPKYIVNHYKENLDGTYYLDESATTQFYLESSQTATATPLTYEGFVENTSHADRVPSYQGAAGSENTLKLYYSRKLYTVKFYDAEGGVHNTQTVKYQGSAIQPQAPSKASTEQYDYTFTGWDKEFTNVVQNLDVYPQYSQSLRKYTITYNYQGATSVGVASNTIEYGSNVVLPEEQTFEKTGHIFKGWFTMPNGEGTEITTSNVVTGEMTIYAYWEKPSYKVSYYKENLDGTYTLAELETLSGLEGSTVTAPSKFYEGFELDSINSENILSDVVKADGSTQLKAHYNRKIYNIVFDYQDATVSGMVYSSAKYEANIIVPNESTFSRDGYTFVGWFTEPYGAGDRATAITVSSDIVLYAYWSQRPLYTVEHYKQDVYGVYSNTPDITETYDADAGETVSVIPYNYIGFKVDYNLSFMSDEVASDGTTVLRVYYERDEFIVKFYDDTEGLGNVYDTQLVRFEGDASEPTSPFKASTPQYYYTFTGWDKAFTNVTQNLDIYPLFNRTVRSYEITYDYQGAIVYSDVYSNTLEYGANVIIPDRATFEKTGYIFRGWFTEPNGEGLPISSSDLVIDDISIYAYWEKPSYKVSYYKENLDGTYSWAETITEYAVAGSEVSAPIKNYQGFSFDTQNADNLLSALVAIDETTELKVYFNRNLYVVKFYNAAGEVLDTQSIKYQGSASLPQPPTKESTEQYHFTFTGWDKIFNNVIMNLEIYPQFSQSLRSYTVTFDYQDATVVGVASKTVAYGQTYVLPAVSTFSKTGHTFDAWYTSAGKQGTKIDANSIVTADITLYAGWNVSGGGGGAGGGGGGGGGPVQLTVKFDSNGGSKVDNIKAELGGKISAPADPVKEGYKFTGWYIDKALRNKYNFDSVLKAGMTLYAAWEEKTEEEKQQEKDEEKEQIPEPEPNFEIAKVLNTDPSIQFIKGDDKGNFNPANSVTRAEVSVMIYRLLIDIAYENETSFVDIPHDEWYSTQVRTLASKGIIKGYDDGTFRPTKAVTRAEFAAILSRMVTNTQPEQTFGDVNDSHWAFENIATAYKNGWIMGYEDGNFRPDAVINRAEAVTILNRVLKKEVATDNVCTFPDVPKDHWAYYQICASSN